MSQVNVQQLRVRVPILLFTTLVFLAVALFGCGGGSSAPSSNNGVASPTPSGSPPGSGSPSPSVSRENLYIDDSLDLGVTAYKIDVNSGTLTSLSNPTVPSPGAPFMVGPITLAAARGFLYAPGVDPNNASGITTYSIDSSTGAITLVPTMWNGPANQTFSFAYVVADSTLSVIYAAGSFNMPLPNGSSGGTVLAALSVGADGGLTMLPGSLQNGVSGSLSLDPAGRFLYLYTSQSQLFVFSRNADGSIGPQVSGSPFTVGPTPNFPSPFGVLNACFFSDVQPDLALSPSGNFMYLSCTIDAEIKVFSVASSGTLTPVQSVAMPDATSEISSLTLDPSGKFLIGTQEEKNQVVVWSVDAGSGKVAQAATAAAGMRPNWSVVEANGKFVYVSNGSSNIFKANLFPGSDNLSAYQLGSNGALTPLAGLPVATGHGPRGLVVVAH